ncbi:MAG: hypothetical protein QM527_11370 [Alphaproteobacteria bacterium]|nr:hypothetical protein [Alphaproteobacteria bacterium]
MSLREIERIRIKRVADAERDLRLAKEEKINAEKKLIEAQDALQSYQRQLPSLIEKLYSDCIGRFVTTDFVQGKVHNEVKLRAKTEDLKAQVTLQTKQLDLAKEQEIKAQQNLIQQNAKFEAIQVMLKEEKKSDQIKKRRLEGKVLDDLASSKYVRMH